MSNFLSKKKSLDSWQLFLCKFYRLLISVPAIKPMVCPTLHFPNALSLGCHLYTSKPTTRLLHYHMRHFSLSSFSLSKVKLISLPEGVSLDALGPSPALLKHWGQSPSQIPVHTSRLQVGMQEGLNITENTILQKGRLFKLMGLICISSYHYF